MSTTATQLSAFSGVLLALVFQYFPRLKEKFGAQPDNQQRLYMLGMLALAAVAAFGLGCAQVHIPGVELAVTCDQQGAIGLGQVLLYAVVSNQAVFSILPNPNQK